MPRYLLCDKCRNEFMLHPEDKAMLLEERRVEIDKARRPPDLKIVTTVTEGGKTTRTETPVPVMKCDRCDGPIKEGAPCVAVTHWRGERPAMWEYEYGYTEA